MAMEERPNETELQISAFYPGESKALVSLKIGGEPDDPCQVSKTSSRSLTLNLIQVQILSWFCLTPSVGLIEIYGT